MDEDDLTMSDHPVFIKLRAIISKQTALLNEQAAALNEQAAARNEQAAKQAAAIARQNKSFFEGIPKLRRIGLSTSTVSRRNTEFACRYTPAPYHVSFSTDEFVRPDDPFLWIYSRHNIYSRTEHMIACYVDALLVEILSAIPHFKSAQNKVDIIPQSSSQGRFPDAIVLRRQGDIPFFVVEVKRPGIFAHKRQKKKVIYGQMFDYLSDIRADYGVEKPYGMLTTYNQFQICWLDGNSADRHLNVSDTVWNTDVSQTVTFQAMAVIASAIIGAFNSPVTTWTPTSKVNKFCKVFTPKKMVWKKASTHLLFEFPSRRTSSFYIKGRFSPGIEGKSYHVFSDNGKQAVLKFICKRQDAHRASVSEDRDDTSETSENARELTLLKRECGYWFRINDLSWPRIIVANRKYGLLMPYLEPLTRAEKEQFLDEKSSIFMKISKLFDNCVEKGLYQTDASWRHVGWFKYGSGDPEVKLFDFGHVEEFDPTNAEEKRESKEAMLAQLRHELEIFSDEFYSES